MKNPLLLLTTCGTSILTNGGDPATNKWLRDIANRTEAELEPTERKRLADLVAMRAAALAAMTPAEQCRQSAEINGIYAVLRDWQPTRVDHLLVHSDTAPGRATAVLVAGILQSGGTYPQMLTAGGLRTSDPADFRAALPTLTHDVRQFAVAARASGSDVVFNLTGGFKSVNAYLQAIGMLLADVCVFLFESEAALMRIPRAPLREFTAQDLLPHRELFRRLAMGYSVLATDARAVPDALLFEVDGQVQMSPWAELLWAEHRDSFYVAELLPPLSPRVRCEPALAKTFAGLHDDRRQQVNTALDETSVQQDGLRKPKTEYELKRLKANPKPPYTHEIDIGRNDGLCRLFAHLEDGHLVIGDLLNAVH
jgi:putative CRISPR-associated protein (TIGR02619 family)